MSGSELTEAVCAEMGVRDVADYVLDRGARGPAEAFANRTFSPSLQQESLRPESPSPSPPPPPPLFSTHTHAHRAQYWNVSRALTSVASLLKHAPTPPITSPPSALASRTRRRPLFGLLARGHRRRSNTLDAPTRPFSIGVAVARAPQPSSQPGITGTDTATNQNSPSPASPSPNLMTTAPISTSPPAQTAEPAALAPSKASLKTWWNHFTFAQRAKKEAEEKKAATGESAVFRKPLKESLKCANVQISTANANGELYVWGYIPVVVAKWCVAAPPLLRPIHLWAHSYPSGLYLKENGTWPILLRGRSMVLRMLQRRRWRGPSESMDQISVCGNSRRPLRPLHECVLRLPIFVRYPEEAPYFAATISTGRTLTGKRSSTRHTTLQASSDDTSRRCQCVFSCISHVRTTSRLTFTRNPLYHTTCIT